MTHPLHAARSALLYVLVTGIVAVVLLPIFFLVSLSFMSDAETYKEWPLPLVPSFRVQLEVERLTADRARISRFHAGREAYEPLIEGDAEELAAFVRARTNGRLAADALRERIERLDVGDRSRFAAPKNLLANYAMFFRVTTQAVPALMRSLLVCGLTMAISLLVGGLAGYAFARYRFAGRNALRLSALFVRMFPGVAVAIPMVVILARVRLFDQPLGLALVYSVGQIGLTVWITAGVFAGIPVELEEAAMVFGTTRLGAFRRITLRLALPGLAACAMYAFIGAWNETIQALVLTQANPTFPVVVYESLVGAKGMVNLAAAGGVTMALPAVVFTLIIRRYILNIWSGASG